MSVSNIAATPADLTLGAPSPAVLSPLLEWLVERAAAREDSAPHAAAADPGAYAQALIAAGRVPDAIRLVACALPPREGVWWAWVSARHVSQLATPPGVASQPVADTLAAVERWINQPND